MHGKQLFDAAVCALAQHPAFAERFCRLANSAMPCSCSLNSTQLSTSSTTCSQFCYSRPRTPVSAQARPTVSPAYFSAARMHRAALEADVCGLRTQRLQLEVQRCQRQLSLETANEHAQERKIQTLKRAATGISRDKELETLVRTQRAETLRTVQGDAKSLEVAALDARNALLALSQAYDGFRVRLRAGNLKDTVQDLFAQLRMAADRKLIEAAQLAEVLVECREAPAIDQADMLLTQQRNLQWRFAELQSELKAENLRLLGQRERRFHK